MNETWHVVELYCSTCDQWFSSSVGTSRSNFESADPFIKGTGKFILPCGHEVMADNYQARLGPEIPMPPDSKGAAAS